MPSPRAGSIPRLIAEQVLARRDRSAAARDRFHAKSDRAAARLDRIVSANERVESSMDGLTGAYRRDAGLLELEHEIARAHRTGDSFVLAFVDVNNLKVRNDLHGHIAGDRLLRKIADTLRANVRSYDLVVRYGGDEFICGFPALDVNDAAERFARINEDLAASDEASVAFGLAELERGDSLTGLIAKADALMYANRYQRTRDPERRGRAPRPRRWARSPRAPSDRAGPAATGRRRAGRPRRAAPRRWCRGDGCAGSPPAGRGPGRIGGTGHDTPDGLRHPARRRPTGAQVDADARPVHPGGHFGLVLAVPGDHQGDAVGQGLLGRRRSHRW